MKNLKISVLILLCSVVALSSCEKEEIIKPNSTSKKAKGLESTNKDGGGDDDDTIIIYGVTQNFSSDLIQDVNVVIFESSSSNPVDTAESNSVGEFEFSVNQGSYYFEATASGYQYLQTSDYTFTTNDIIVLTLEE